MTYFKVGVCLLIGGFVFNFLETWYFGWNLKPSCPAEMVCDYIATFAMLIGMIIVLIPIFKGLDC